MDGHSADAPAAGLAAVGENRFAVRWGWPLSWTILGHTCLAKVLADECAAIALGDYAEPLYSDSQPLYSIQR